MTSFYGKGYYYHLEDQEVPVATTTEIHKMCATKNIQVMKFIQQNASKIKNMHMYAAKSTDRYISVQNQLAGLLAFLILKMY